MVRGAAAPDKKRQEMAVMIGIPGAGKTTFYVERFFHTHVRLSLDMLKTRARELALARACIAVGQSFVVDNTNVLASERAPFIAEAKSAGFRVTGYLFVPNVRRSIALNNKRAAGQKVPVFGLLRAFKRLESPSADEGFDAVYQVDWAKEAGFVVEPWTAQEPAADSSPPNSSSR